MNLILWIVFGAIAGWIMSIIVSNVDRRYTLSSVIVGSIGGLTGGFLMEKLAGTIEGINYFSLITAVGGSLLIVLFFHGRNTHQNQR